MASPPDLMVGGEVFRSRIYFISALRILSLHSPSGADLRCLSVRIPGLLAKFLRFAGDLRLSTTRRNRPWFNFCQGPNTFEVRTQKKNTHLWRNCKPRPVVFCKPFLKRRVGPHSAPPMHNAPCPRAGHGNGPRTSTV